MVFFFFVSREMDLLSMPSNRGIIRLVQWPLFLLSSKVLCINLSDTSSYNCYLAFSAFSSYYSFQILLAIDLALDCKDTQADLWNRICRDEYMAYAVQECYYSIEKILHSLVDGEGRLWCNSYHIWNEIMLHLIAKFYFVSGWFVSNIIVV